MEVLQEQTNFIIIEASEQEKQDAKTLKQIRYRFKGFTKEQYDEYVSTHKFYQDYDLSAETRQKHDEELAEWRAVRDKELRLSLHIELNPNLTDYEKWQELRGTYPLEPDNRKAGFYKAVPILHFGDRLEREV